jgi:hypothetical protein
MAFPIFTRRWRADAHRERSACARSGASLRLINEVEGIGRHGVIIQRDDLAP